METNVNTLRLMITLECNFRCSYCCNKLDEVNSKFLHKSLQHINFNEYENICITGGEPFLNKMLFYDVLEAIPDDKNIYVYTNGMLINILDTIVLGQYPAIKGINIGLHSLNQFPHVRWLNRSLDNLRYMIEDVSYEDFLIENKLHSKNLIYFNIKTWERDKCDMPNEDWIVLKEMELDHE